MTLYLAGKMSGEDLFNFPAFDACALMLRREGYDVVNPAEIDRTHNIHEFTKVEDLPEGWRRGVIKRDLDAICEFCDGIAILPHTDWMASRGVRVELALAAFLDLPVHTVDEWVEQARLHAALGEDDA